MLDPNLFRNNIEQTAKQLAKRGFSLDVKTITELENKRKILQTDTQQLQNERNQISQQIGFAKSKKQDASELLEKANQISNQVTLIEKQLEEIQQQLLNVQLEIPNIPHESVPEGLTEDFNQEVRKWGTPRKFDFKPKDHVDLGEKLGMLDFAAAAKISGARFVVMYGQLVQLQRALIRFMLDLHLKNNYKEVYVPYLVNQQSLYGVGQLPKFAADLFHISGESNLSLIPTAEVPLTNLMRDTIIAADNLPLKLVAHTPCFRSEAGSYGKDTRGMIRQHQFEKIELVQFVEPTKSYEALETLTNDAEIILQKLNLPYRVINKCVGDLGFSAAKTYDLEVWLPSQNTYREISSCSNFEAFQARRIQARWKNPNTNKNEFIHTLNGSALAVGRTVVAIMENYQDEQGNIKIPDVLISYMENEKTIKNQTL